MKALELERMESLDGGCSIFGVIISGAGVALGSYALIAAAAAGPIGWGAIGIFAASRVLGVAGVLSACDVI